MGRRLPPFTAVRAFEAAARLHSFKAASAELCVTQSAVSHQIAALEQFLDVALFLRSGGKVELTPSGSRYYADLTLILDRLDQSTQETRAAKSCRPLSICSTPMFALRWLLPRLKRFSSTYPEIELEVTTTDCPMHFPAYGVDVLVQYGTARAKGLDVEPFLISARHPVCSPRFLDRNPQILTLSGLAQSTLLHDLIGDDWMAWFHSAGLEAPVRLGGPRFSHCELSVRAAEEDQGVALAYEVLVEGEVERGSLIRLFDFKTMPKTVYSLTCLEDAAKIPGIAAFKSWAFKELREGKEPRH